MANVVYFNDGVKLPCCPTLLESLYLSASGTCAGDCNANYTGFVAGDLSYNIVYTLPTASGTSGQVLTTDGNNNLSWTTVSGGGGGGTPAGIDGYIQYNNGGSFGGASILYWNDLNSRLGIGTATPNQTLEVAGTMRLTGSTGTPVSILGRDANGDISNVALGSNFLLSGGTLSLSGVTVSGYVPYTGATQNVNLGSFSLASSGVTTPYLQISTAGSSTPMQEGMLRWNDTDRTYEFMMGGGNVLQQIGQELPVPVKHADSAGLENGKVVYYVSSDGTNKLVRYAIASGESESAGVFGLMTEDASGGSKGLCTTFGYVRDIDTSTLEEGKIVWLSDTELGGMTTTRPTQPSHGVQVGFCIRQHATEGAIFVSIQNGYELDELHNVLISSGITDQEILFYNSALKVWQNKTAAAANLVSGSGTATQVAFWKSGSTNELQGNSNLYWDNVNTRLGVGTTTPSGTVSIQGIGTGSTTKPFVVANSATTAVFEILDNGRINQTIPNAVNNTLFGTNAGTSTIGSSNSFFGVNTGFATTIGSFNSFFGINAGRNNTTGSANSFFGRETGVSNTTGGSNSFFGTNAGFDLTTGSNNSIFGTNAGRFLVDGVTSITIANNSVFLGVDTKANGNNQTNQTVIGYNAIGLGSNTTVIGNTGTTQTHLHGNLTLGSTNAPTARMVVTGADDTNTGWTAQFHNALGNSNSLMVRNDGNVGVGTNAPTQRLHVEGQIYAAQTITTLGNLRPSGNVSSVGGIGNTSGTQFVYNAGNSFQPTSGTATLVAFLANNTINQTGGASGTTRGLLVNPVLTSAFDWRSIEWTNSSGWGLYGAGTANNYLGGNLSVGTTGTTARLVVVGSQPSGTTTWTAQFHNALGNSNSLMIRDDGNVGIGTTTMTGRLNFTDNGTWGLYGTGTSPNYLAGSLGIGTTLLSNRSLHIGKNIGGSTTAFGVQQTGVVQSGVTTSYGFANQLNTASGSAINNFSHYYANQSTINGTITNQYGYFVESNLTGATNNYGFYSAISEGLNRWNFYAFGSAKNYFAGNTAIGTTAQNASAAFEVASTTQGFLSPRMTTAQRDAIVSPATGLELFNTSIGSKQVYNGTEWEILNGARQAITASSSTTSVVFRNGNIADIVLSSSTTLTFSNAAVGTYIVKITQGGSGFNLVSWPANVLWSGGIVPTLTTAVGKTDIFTFVFDSTNYYGSYALNY